MRWLIIIICSLLFVSGCVSNVMRDYGEEKECFIDIAKIECGFRNLDFYVVDYRSDRHLVNYHSKTPIYFLCINKTSRDVKRFNFLIEELRFCVGDSIIKELGDDTNGR